MTRQTTYCDKCHKVIKGRPYELIFFKPKRFIVSFAEISDFTSKNHDLCYDCWKELRDWYENGTKNKEG